MAVSVSYPGVYLEEAKSGVVPISGVSTSVAAFVGEIDTALASVHDKAIKINNWGAFQTIFGADDASEMAHAVKQFFVNGGSSAFIVATNGKSRQKLLGDAAARTGMYALEAIAPDIFNILCIPDAGRTGLGKADYKAIYAEAHAFCVKEDALLLVDIPEEGKVTDPDPLTKTKTWTAANLEDFLQPRGIQGLKNAAVFFPRVEVPALGGSGFKSCAASGTIAGVCARTDSEVGVWKAPAGTGARLANASPERVLNDADNGDFYKDRSYNCLRTFPIYGNVNWGARTLAAGDELEWRYIPVRRTALFLKKSLYQGLQWVVFEPNDFRLWGQIRLNVTSFMHRLFRRGAFQGETAKQAYFVKCDSETTTQADIDLGIVNIVVGFAPLKPAEFVVLTIQQIVNQDTP